MVAPRGGIKTTLGNLGRNFAGRKDSEATGREIHKVVTRGR